jgi:hypothetical protein
MLPAAAPRRFITICQAAGHRPAGRRRAAKEMRCLARDCRRFCRITGIQVTGIGKQGVECETRHRTPAAWRRAADCRPARSRSQGARRPNSRRAAAFGTAGSTKAPRCGCAGPAGRKADGLATPGATLAGPGCCAARIAAGRVSTSPGSARSAAGSCITRAAPSGTLRSAPAPARSDQGPDRPRHRRRVRHAGGSLP